MLLSGLVLGILGSLHCVGMCGPIAFLLPVSRDNRKLQLLQIGSYHLGRFTAYALLGLLFGFLGQSLSLFGAQQYLSIIAGVILLLAVAIPQRVLFKYSLSKPLALAIGKLKSAMGSALKSKRPDTFLTLGLLNGFLPCGLVYMAVFASLATANPWQGSLYMTLFGLGTLPLMTGAIYAGNFLNKAIQHRIRKAIPVLVALVACLFILRGLGLGIPYVSPKAVSPKVEANLECH